MFQVYFLKGGNTHRSFMRMELVESIGLFGFFSKKRPAGGIDIEMKEGVPTISYFQVTDERFSRDMDNMYGHPLTAEEASMVKSRLFEHAEMFAYAHGASKIRMDVHKDLKTYHADVKPFGFQLSDKRAEDNRFWIQTFKQVVM